MTSVSTTHLNHMEEKKCRIVALPRIVDPRGNLTVAEAHKQLPFAIKRAYWVYDVPGGEVAADMLTSSVASLLWR